jgi:hypothetical protein
MRCTNAHAAPPAASPITAASALSKRTRPVGVYTRTRGRERPSEVEGMAVSSAARMGRGVTWQPGGFWFR